MNIRNFAAIAFTFASTSLFVTEPVAAQSFSREQLKGWGPFQFGMAATDALNAAMPSVRFDHRNPEKMVYPVVIGMVNYEATVSFKNGALRNINLSTSNAVKKGSATVATCHARFYELVAQLSNEYGGLPENERRETDLNKKSSTLSVEFPFMDGNRIVASGTYSAPNKSCLLNIGYWGSASSNIGKF